MGNTLVELKRAARRMGATVAIDRSAFQVEIKVTAPDGQQWRANGCTTTLVFAPHNTTGIDQTMAASLLRDVNEGLEPYEEEEEEE